MRPAEDQVSDAAPETAPSRDASEGAYQAHFEGLLDRFDGHARKAFRDASVVSIHELRVAYKMLRATLAPLVSPDPSDLVRAAARPVRRLFRAAGPLRECHIHRDLLLSHLEQEALMIPEWIHALTAREITARRRFLDLAPVWKSSVILHLSHVVRLATADCDATELEWRARSLFAVAASRLADVQHEHDWSSVDLHRVRRVAKDARYLLGLVGTLAPEKDPDRDLLDTALRDVHRALGGWHDATVAGIDVRSFLDQRGGKSLRHPDLYAAYTERLTAAAQGYRAQFDGAWRGLLAALGVHAAAAPDVVPSGGLSDSV